MLTQNHSQHWHTIYDEAENLNACFHEIVDSGEFELGRRTPAYIDGMHRDSTPVGLFKLHKGEITTKLLVAKGFHKENDALGGFYFTGKPMASCPSVRVKQDLMIWDNLIEANIEAETITVEGRNFNFYCPNYLQYKVELQFTKEIEVDLIAFAYTCEILKETEFQFEGQQALDFLAKSGRTPEYDEHGNVKPIVFNLANMVALLPKGEEIPDIYTFQSPIHEIEEVEAWGMEFYRMKITVSREDDNDTYATLYARKSLFGEQPHVGDPLRGCYFLQGNITDTITKLIDETSPKTFFTEMTKEYFQFIRSFDYRKGFYDLTTFQEKFKHIRLREGYVLDGYWLKRHNDRRMKLYVCKANTEWKYDPEIVDGKVVPEFNDAQYIDNDIEYALAGSIPPLDGYIEGPFTEEAIWEAYILHVSDSLLPQSKNEDVWVPIFSKGALLGLTNDIYARYAYESSWHPMVTILDDSSAIVRATYWSETEGLFTESLPVLKTQNGYEFGHPTVRRYDK